MTLVGYQVCWLAKKEEGRPVGRADEEGAGTAVVEKCDHRGHEGEGDDSVGAEEKGGEHNGDAERASKCHLD